MPSQPTRSQQKALDDARHLAIIANAGSGKTKVLVDRYLKLLIEHPELLPRSIVAITFTDSAAADIRRKISEAIDERMLSAEATQDSSLFVRLREIREGFVGANISTIHAFAGRILRAYPVEVNLDATAKVISGADRELVLEETIARTFEQLLNRAYAGDTSMQVVLQLFRRCGRTAIAEIIATFLRSSRWTSLKFRTMLECSNEQIVATWEKELSDWLAPHVDPLYADLQLLLPFAKSKGKAKADAFREAMGRWDVTASIFARAQVVCDAYRASITNNGTANKQVFDGEIPLELPTSCVYHFQFLSPLASTFSGDFRISHTHYLDTVVRPLFTVFDAVWQGFVEVKTKYSVIEFDDQIALLHQLVSNPTIAEELSQQFPYLMIDEFQDTDDIQSEIAYRLTGALRGSTNLTIVGDPKQAIYSFRNADLRVFNAMVQTVREQELSEQAKETSAGLTTEEEHGIIALRESFRMADAPLAFVNSAFRTIFEAERLDSSYTELVAARAPRMHGSVEIIYPHAALAKFEPIGESVSDASSSDDAEPFDIDSIEETAAEFDILASRIRMMIHGEHRVQIQEPGGLRDAAYGDVAILLRTRASMPGVELALQRYGIPYQVAKGTDFFSQQEVLDLINYLRFLARPNNDVALFGLLRSPLFAFSDTFFLQLNFWCESHRVRSLNLWSRLLAAAEDETFVTNELRGAVAELQHNRALAGRISASTLLDRILDETVATGIYQSMPNGSQRVANLQKLVDLVRTVEEAGFRTLLDTIERLEHKIEGSSEDAQARIAGEDAVRIMTIHGAKGLEFPIVCVSALQKEMKNGSRDAIDATLGPWLRTASVPKPAIAELLKLQRERAQIEEEKRILYVALTRARDHLILSASQPTRGSAIPNRSLLSLFDSTLLARWMNPQIMSYSTSEKIERYDVELGKTTIHNIELTVPIHRTTLCPPPATERNAAATEMPQLHLERYTAAKQLARFSPSQLLTLSECSTKYYLRYLVGLPEEPKLIYEYEAADHAERVQATLYGQIVHKMFEHLDRITNGNRLNDRAFGSYLTSLADRWSVSDAERITLARDVRHDIELFLRDPLYTIVRDAQWFHTEHLVQSSLTETELIRGVVDRLMMRSDGVIQIIDFKTDSKFDRASHKRERYKFQLRFYAYLVSLLYPEQPSIAASLYFTRLGVTESFVFDREDVASMRDELTTLMEQARAMDAVSDLSLLNRNLDHCAECGYYTEGSCVLGNVEVATIDIMRR